MLEAVGSMPWLHGVIGIIRPIVILSKFQGSHTVSKDLTKRLQSLQQPCVLYRPLGAIVDIIGAILNDPAVPPVRKLLPVKRPEFRLDRVFLGEQQSKRLFRILRMANVQLAPDAV